MKLKIFGKLYLAVLLATSVVILFMVVVTNWNFRQGFANYEREVDLERVECLAAFLVQTYPDQEDWSFLVRNPILWLSDISTGLSCNAEANGTPVLPRSLVISLDMRLRLLNKQGELLKGPELSEQPFDDIPIISEGRQVGSIQLIVPDQSENARAITQKFVQQQSAYRYLTALFAALLSLVVTLVVVRQLVEPVRKLTEGAKSLSQGRFSTHIIVNSNDELGELARCFNQLADFLQRNEELRAQWIADVSHELRTPLAVLRSEIEAVLDGIRKPDMERIRSLHTETLSLSQLVDDLYQLSLSDAGDIDLLDEVVELGDLLDDLLFAFESRLDKKRITLLNHLDQSKTYPVRGDDKRLYQLFSNLLENSNRYTDAGGSIRVSVSVQSEQVVIEIMDSAPGVPAAALPRLFDRLYRVDKSRSRALGGSGLGLSICRNIVNMHNGQIEADHSVLGGLLIRVRLPLFRGNKAAGAIKN